jgi:hypothetical protein
MEWRQKMERRPMKFIVDLSIVCDAPGNRYVYAIVRKEFETDLVPMVGMKFEDSEWKDSRDIRAVAINPAEGYYLLYVGEDARADKDQCEQLKRVYHAAGWTGRQ